jgi:glycosyltransferase involved in cell wall biosynthesis
MSLGRPVLATNWSGVTEFMAEGTALPIVPEGLEVGSGGDCRWARVGVDQVSRLLRELYEMSPQQRTHLGAAARKHIVQHFAPEEIRDRIVDRLQTIFSDQLFLKEQPYSVDEWEGRLECEKAYMFAN